MKKLLLFSLLFSFSNLFIFGQLCKDDQPIGQNLIENGDFEQGNAGFSTDLSLFSGDGSAELYYVGSDPRVFNQAFRGVDNTKKDGTGNMLMLDASNDPNKTRMWYQMVEVKPNTNYYFTAHVANILGPTSQIIPQLLFKVNGELLVDTIDAPAALNQWNSVTSPWYSGTASGFIEISIENIKIGGTGEGGGNDMALDDISFVEGCEFASQNIIPELGADTLTICGTSNGVLELKPTVPSGNTYEYIWSTGENTPQINVSKPGRYAVCMKTNGGCFLSDIVTITDEFKVDLGPDIDLCNPATAALNPSYDLGSGYDWYKDGALQGDVRNQKTIEVNSVGTYKVVVHDLVCEDEEDEVVISSSTIQAVNANFCPADGDSVKLSITNAPADSINYVWYSDAALTDSVGFGLNFKTADTLTKTTSFYVKDVSTNTVTFGPTISNYNDQGFPDADPDKVIKFDVLNDLSLDTLTVYPIFYNSQNLVIGISIQELVNGAPSTEVFNETKIFTPNSTDFGVPTTPFRFPIGINLDAGKSYRIRRIAPGRTWIYNKGSEIDLTLMNNQPDNIEITGFTLNGQMPGFFDWVITSGSVCDPVQVQAVYDPIACAGCTPPELENTPLNLGVSCNSDPVTLKANVIGGINNGSWNYLWTKNGDTLLTAIDDSLVVAFPDSGDYTVTVSDNSAGDICFETREFRVDLTSPLEPIVVIEIALDEPICLLERVSTSAKPENFSVEPTLFTWSVNGIVDISQSSEVFEYEFTKGDTLVVQVSGLDNCGDLVTATDTTIIQELDPIVPEVTLSISPQSICSGEVATVTADITPESAAIGGEFLWTDDNDFVSDSLLTYSDVFVNNEIITLEFTIKASGCYSETVFAPSVTASVSNAVNPNVYIVADTNNICENESITFSVVADSLRGAENPNYLWRVGSEIQTGNASAITLSDLNNGEMITVEMETSSACATQSSDTSNAITVSVLPTPTVDLTRDELTFTRCAGDTIDYIAIASPANGTFEWRVNKVLVPLATGNTFSSDMLNNTDTVTVVFNPEAPISKCGTPVDTAFVSGQEMPENVAVSLSSFIACDDDEHIIYVLGDHGLTPSYVWFVNKAEQIGLIGDSIDATNLSDSTEIRVEVRSSKPCIVKTDTLISVTDTIEKVIKPTAVLAENQIVLSEFKEVVLDGTASSGGDVTYRWISSDITIQDDIIGSNTDKATITTKQPVTTFDFTVSKKSRTTAAFVCEDSDSVQVIVDFKFEIPNAFTPNGDGLNDLFQIDNLEALDAFRLQIFNRWGTLLYEQKGLSDFWDGTHNGSPVPVATYYYVFEYELDGEKQEPKKDFISLIR